MNISNKIILCVQCNRKATTTIQCIEVANKKYDGKVLYMCTWHSNMFALDEKRIIKKPKKKA